MNERVIYNYKKLKGKIVEVCETQEAFAKLIGLSDRSVTFRMNNKRDWTQTDIERAVKVLGIPREEIPVYFYTIA